MTSANTTISTLIASATASDLRRAASECRAASTDSGNASRAHWFLIDLGYDQPIEAVSWRRMADWLDSQADRMDPPRGRVVLYTTAPAAYDGGGTKELADDCGIDNRGLTIRKVMVQDRDLVWQMRRYDSGLHGVATVTDVKRSPSIWGIREGF